LAGFYFMVDSIATTQDSVNLWMVLKILNVILNFTIDEYYARLYFVGLNKKFFFQRNIV
jgi:hypothetical protein